MKHTLILNSQWKSWREGVDPCEDSEKNKDFIIMEGKIAINWEDIRRIEEISNHLMRFLAFEPDTRDWCILITDDGESYYIEANFQEFWKQWENMKRMNFKVEEVIVDSNSGFAYSYNIADVTGLVESNYILNNLNKNGNSTGIFKS